MSWPTNVLFLHPSDEAYGADRVLLDIVLGLRERGHSVSVLLADDLPSGWLSARLVEAGVHVRRTVIDSRKQVEVKVGVWHLACSIGLPRGNRVTFL